MPFRPTPGQAVDDQHQRARDDERQHQRGPLPQRLSGESGVHPLRQRANHRARNHPARFRYEQLIEAFAGTGFVRQMLCQPIELGGALVGFGTEYPLTFVQAFLDSHQRDFGLRNRPVIHAVRFRRQRRLVRDLLPRRQFDTVEHFLHVHGGLAPDVLSHRRRNVAEIEELMRNTSDRFALDAVFVGAGFGGPTRICAIHQREEIR